MTDAEIREIEKRYFGVHTGIIMDLLATVKEQRDQATKERDALRAENARFQAALEKIKSQIGIHGNPRLTTTELYVFEIAKAALAGKENQVQKLHKVAQQPLAGKGESK